jgi:hypothetical protein
MYNDNNHLKGQIKKKIKNPNCQEKITKLQHKNIHLDPVHELHNK